MFDKPVSYKSPLRIHANYPSLVVYKCSITDEVVGKVYKNPDGKWFLSTRYMGRWSPVEVFAKYSGFLFLNRLHKTETWT